MPRKFKTPEEDNPVLTGTGEARNCVHDGKEYSPGSIIKQIDGRKYACDSGVWKLVNPKEPEVL